MRLREDRPKGIAAAGHERDQAQGQEDAQRAENRDHFQENQKKLGAVGSKLDLRRSVAPAGVDWLEAHAVAGLHERQGRRRWSGEAVWQQVQKFDEALPSRGSKSRRQIRNLLSGEVARDAVQQRVAGAARQGGLRSVPPRADHEIVGVELRHESSGIARSVLAVGVDDQDEPAGGAADAGFDRRAVALVVRMTNHACAGRRGVGARVVARSIVDDDDFVPARGREELGDDRTNRRAFVECWDDDRHGVHDITDRRRDVRRRPPR